MLLLIIWVGLATGAAPLQVLLQVASLWIVKLRIKPEEAKKKKRRGGGVVDVESVANAPFLKRGSKSPSRSTTKSSAKPSAKAAKGTKTGRQQKKK